MFCLILVYISYMLMSAPTNVVSSIWPDIAKAIGTSETSLATMMGIDYVIMTIFLSLSSKSIEKIGARNTIVTGLVAIAIGFFSFSISKSLIFCIVCSMVFSAGMALIDTAANYFVSIFYSPRSLGFLHFSYGLGVTVISYIVGKALSTGITYDMCIKYFIPIYALTAIIIFIFTKISGKMPVKSDLNPDDKEKNVKFTLKEIFAIKNTKRFFVSQYLTNFMAMNITVWFSTYIVASHNISVSDAAKIFSIYFAGITVSRVIESLIVEKFGTKKIIYINLLLFLIGMILFTILPKTIYIIMITMFIVGLGVGSTYPAHISFAKEVFGLSKLNGIIGFAGSSAQIGSMCASVLVGIILRLLSFDYYLYIVFIINILSFINFYLLNKNIKEV